MKRLIPSVLAFVAGGCLFLSCSDTKTYAEQLEDERNAIDEFIAEKGIKVISEEEFLTDTITDVELNEYVVFTNGVYMQIVKRYGEHNPHKDKPYTSVDQAPKFEDGNSIVVRYSEYDIMNKYLTSASIYDNSVDYYNTYPDMFRYTYTSSTSYSGQFLKLTGTAYYYGWGMAASYDAKVPQAWVMVLPYLRDGAQIKLIVPSKTGHTTAQNYVYPFFYDIRSLYIY